VPEVDSFETLSERLELASGDLQPEASGFAAPSLEPYGDPLSEARSALRQWGLPSRLSSGRFLPTFAFPSDWMNETTEGVEPSFLEFTAGSKKLEGSPFSSGLTSSRDDFARIRSGGGAMPLQTSPSDMKVSMKLLRVELFRPWFRASLLSLQGLRMHGRPVGCFSRGTPDPIDPDRLIFPLRTTAALIAKDCVVEAPWSAQDRERLSELSSGGGSVQLGPFATRASLEGNKLRFAGLSLVGYLCRQVPFFPPTH
jgi:hypothetical protein